MKNIRYPIPAERTRIEIKIVNSRFITTVAEAQTADEAKAFIKEMREEFSDASHNVFAFRAGYGSSITEGASDDGEPAGTAGRPTLTVLRGADLGDVVLVTTRYFGGTKLGTGGLVRAYTEAAQEALEALPRDVRVEKTQGTLDVPYNQYENIKRLISAHQGEILDEVFAGEVTLELTFPTDTTVDFDAGLRELSAGKLSVMWQEKAG